MEIAQSKFDNDFLLGYKQCFRIIPMYKELDSIDQEQIARTAFLGIDVGSLFFKAVGLAPDGSVIWVYKKAHQGNPTSLQDHIFSLINNQNAITAIAGATSTKENQKTFDPIVCLYTAIRASFPDVRNILEVGASNLTLVRLDTEGQVISIHKNSLCAAGTGSFLDTQAARMGIAYEEGEDNTPKCDPPSIATRCAVFAKSDLVYRQQEGYDTAAMWSGLCRGLVDGLLHTLTSGKPLLGKTILSGGVALNNVFRWWLNNRLNGKGKNPDLEVMPYPEYSVAYGAALLAANNSSGSVSISLPTGIKDEGKRRPPLELKRSKYPDFSAFSSYTDEWGNEVTLHLPPEQFQNISEVYLGLDIGSTSTKLAIVDQNDQIICDIYRRTEADPTAAVKKLFLAISEIDRKHHIRFSVKAAATTGAGRKLISHVIGADKVINEISAHVEGAINIDPSIETIFEIGGQDAKYMSVKEGHLVDANMNYVCAAGTGSFIDELAIKLGYSIEEIGGEVMGVAPPYTSSRCTVFMEQDIQTHLQRGLSRREAAGAVMYSIIENYLERVVGQRPVSQSRVFFQGATARNLGLVAALENILGVEVIVSPYCHVMGAYGAALTAKKENTSIKTQFRGFDLANKDITIANEICELCNNRCSLSKAVIDGESGGSLWGMRCGREESDTQLKQRQEFSLFQKVKRLSMATKPQTKAELSKPTVLLPRALSTYSLLPFWNTFFDELGFDLHLGREIDQQAIELGNRHVGAEFCLPVKAAVGQMADILNDTTQNIFVPHLLAEKPASNLTYARYCPYVEAFPSLLKAILQDKIIEQERFLTPVVDFSQRHQSIAKELYESLKSLAPLRQKDVEKALEKAFSSRSRFDDKIKELGRLKLEDIKASGKPAVVIIGRPYNAFDEALNQDIPYYIACQGFEVIPMDCLEWDPTLLEGDFTNLFWQHGQRILSALIQIAKTQGLYAIYLSNYSCGPDSFLLTYAETIMGSKPFLALEVDEHGSSGGYQTRIEAFLDVVRSNFQGEKKATPDFISPREKASHTEIKNRKIWIPPMHPVGIHFFAASFRSRGYEAQQLDFEDETTFTLGKKWTRGSECLPAPLTLGPFLHQMNKEKAAGRDPAKENALFLPTSTGPCRFGQYRTMDRIILDRLGYEDIPIFSPGAHNAYYGLDKKLRAKLWPNIIAGDILFKMRCRTLPYETVKGDTIETLEGCIAEAVSRIESDTMNWEGFLKEAAEKFMRIPMHKHERPLIGVVGEIYVRCNAFANNDIVESIEQLGGEAWLAPVTEWILYTSWMERYLNTKNKAGWVDSIGLAAKWKYLSGKEHRMYQYARCTAARSKRT